MTICWFHFFLDDFFQVRDGFDSQPVVLVEANPEFSLKFLKEQQFFFHHLFPMKQDFSRVIHI